MARRAEPHVSASARVSEWRTGDYRDEDDRPNLVGHLTGSKEQAASIGVQVRLYHRRQLEIERRRCARCQAAGPQYCGTARDRGMRHVCDPRDPRPVMTIRVIRVPS